MYILYIDKEEIIFLFLILYADYHQNVIDAYHSKNFMTFIHNFLSDLVNIQTNKQTNKQTMKQMWKHLLIDGVNERFLSTLSVSYMVGC